MHGLRGLDEGLLEREPELAVWDGVLAAARRGAGHTVYLHGPAGIGKTALARACLAEARAQGLHVLAARGAELERHYPFGVVRQLFDGLTPGFRERLTLPPAALGALGGQRYERAEPPLPDAESAALHGLFWACADTAAEQPLALGVDDAHWADSASSRFLAFLAHRLEDLGAVLLVVARDPVDEAARISLEAAASEPAVVELAPAPLTGPAVAELVRRRLGVSADDGFCDACQLVSGGNPFLLVELLRRVEEEAIAPIAASAAVIAELGSRAVARSVLRRVTSSGDAAGSAARAIAVLGGISVRPALVSALAELTEAAATRAIDQLVECGVVADELPLRFAHPLVRSSVYQDIPPAERSRRHRRAATLIAAAGASEEQVAAHLLRVAPAADAWVVAHLRAAAQNALEGGAPDTAATLLRRSLDEPPPASDLGAVLHETGRSAFLARQPDAIALLERALDVTSTTVGRGLVALDLGVAAALAGSPDAAVPALQDAIAELREVDAVQLRHTLEALLIGNTLVNRQAVSGALGQLDALDAGALGDGPGDRRLLAYKAVHTAMRGEPAGQVIELADRALAGQQLILEEPPGSQTAVVLLNVLTLSGAPARAHALFGTMIEQARRLGSITGFASASAFRSFAALRLGRLSEAEADAESALRIIDDAPLGAIRGYALCQLTEARIEQGRIAAAADTLDGGPPDDVSSYDAVWALYARARVHASGGRHRDALRDLLTCGERQEEWGMPNPAWIPWSAHAASAMIALGRPEAARELADAGLSQAVRFGAPWALAVTLQAAAASRPRAEALPLLRRAVAALEDGAAPLERARSLLALGGGLRREGLRRAAVEPLREALELASMCGAQPLVQGARAELATLGIRPRRTARRGLDALTASERRVVAMAAEGLTNRSIAHALFVTPKTIETHLHHAYDKLGVHSRRELIEELSG